MASSYAAGINVSSGVMAKLQKWMGKASAKPNEIRAFNKDAFAAKETKALGAKQTFPISHSNAVPSPIHVRARSAPVQMPEKELRVTKRRKTSDTTSPPTHSPEKESERESEKQIIDLEPKNGIPKAGTSRSVGPNDSSLNQSSLHQKQYVTNNKSRNRASVGGGPADEADGRGNHFVKVNDTMKEINMNSRAATKVNKTARERSCDNSEDSGVSDNEKIGSSSGSPTSVQKLPEQIERRLRKWVEKAASSRSKRNRVSSEESISSTDDSLNPPESPISRSAAGQDCKHCKGGKQAKEMQELKLALKELVENVGVRTGRTAEKDFSSSATGLGRQRGSLQLNSEITREERKKEIAKCKYGSTDNVTTRSEGSRKESSSSDSDGGFQEVGRRANRNKALHVQYSKLRNDSGVLVANNFQECELEDYAKGTLVKDDIKNRELNNNRGPQARKSVTLQEVLISETLIEESPKQEDDGITKKAPLPNGKKTSEANRFGTRNIENFSSKAEGYKKHSGETDDVSEVPKGIEYPKTFFEERGGSLKPGNGMSKKLERPGLQKRSTAPDSSSLRVSPDSTIRDSMRHYLNFKDAELSAFAEECVRHAIRKKRNSNDEDRNNRIDLRKTAASDEFQQKAAETTPSVDQSHYSTDAPKRSSLPNEEAAKEINGRYDKSHFIFARTAEEAEWFEKELSGDKRGKHAKDKASLERLHSNPLQETEPQRLYKFPSLPTFYIPPDEEESDPRKRSKADKPLYRRSIAVTSFPRYSASASTFGSEPLSLAALYHRQPGAQSASERSKSEAKSSSISKLDQVGNSKVEEKGRPFLKKRKLSVPSRLGRYWNSSLDIRVGIEALI